MQTYRIVTACFAAAQKASDSAIVEQDDDDGSMREMAVLAGQHRCVRGRCRASCTMPRGDVESAVK